MIKTLTIRGLRGFGAERQLQFAEPTNEPGSGLTILVGPNNGGKSTIVANIGRFYVLPSQRYLFGIVESDEWRK